MRTIIGIDPGFRRTGYGIIHVKQDQCLYQACGVIDISQGTLSERLQKLFIELQTIIKEYPPHEAAIEQVFVCHNVQSALKLGQARGVAIAALGVAVSEYAPREIKQAIVGYGGADKTQVQQMVKQILNLTKAPSADAADALAIALCHAYTSAYQARLARFYSL